MAKKEKSMNKAIFNWSGGKDSAYCLYKVLQEKQYDVKYLLTTINQANKRISMHGVREELLELQASSLGIALHKIYLPEFPSMEYYNQQMFEELKNIKEQKIHNAIFGDIFLEDLRKYREKQLDQIGMNAVFPLWKINTKLLVLDFIKAGFKAIVVCVDERYLNKSFVGKIIDKEFVRSLPENVDPCGENGEFHSFVFDGPIFKFPISFKTGEIVYKSYKSDDKTNSEVIANGFWYCDLKH